MKKYIRYRYELPNQASQESLEQQRETDYARIQGKLASERVNRLSAFHIMVILVTLGLFFCGALLMEKPLVSKLEKRELTPFPKFTWESLFSGDFTQQVGVWYADTFPFRDAFVGLSAVLDESNGLRLDDVRIIQSTGGEVQDIPADQLSASSVPSVSAPSSSVPSASSQPPQSQTEQLPSASSSQEESVSSQPQPEEPVGEPTELSNGSFVYNGMAMSLFGGSHESGRWYADVLNTYHQELPDVQIYDMIIPTAIEFYVPEKYRSLTQSQKETIDYIYSYLDPSIKRVDALSKIAQHTDEYLYFRTDHHWTGLGAYYAYTAFCETAGLEPVRLEDCETRRLTDFIGTMYAQTQDSTLLKNPDYVDYYIFPRQYTALRYDRGAPYTGIPHTLWGEYAQSPNSYSVFLHGDFPLISVKTDLQNGKKILVVKESFGNAFAPFLINNYEEVYIVDQRYFQLSLIDFIKQNGIQELIFANNSFAACTPYHIQKIDGMRHQVFQYYQPAPQEPAASEPAEESSSQEESQHPQRKEMKQVKVESENEDDEGDL